MVHKDHLAAVMDVDYSPTGREFVSGSYDRTVRIYNVREGKSREVYHTRRMQRVFCVHYSAGFNTWSACGGSRLLGFSIISEICFV